MAGFDDFMSRFNNPISQAGLAILARSLDGNPNAIGGGLAQGLATFHRGREYDQRYSVMQDAQARRERERQATEALAANMRGGRYSPEELNAAASSGSPQGLLAMLNAGPAKRTTLKDAGGFQRFQDSGERVFPDAEKAPPTPTTTARDVETYSGFKIGTPEHAAEMRRLKNKPGVSVNLQRDKIGPLNPGEIYRAETGRVEQVPGAGLTPAQRKVRESVRGIDEGLGEIARFRSLLNKHGTEYGGVLSDNKAQGALGLSHNTLLGVVAKLSAAGVLQEGERKALIEKIPDPTSLGSQFLPGRKDQLLGVLAELEGKLQRQRGTYDNTPAQPQLRPGPNATATGEAQSPAAGGYDARGQSTEQILKDLGFN